ncbi:hypothetical protein ACP4OV_027438 [Aristida adscensionis]
MEPPSSSRARRTGLPPHLVLAASTCLCVESRHHLILYPVCGGDELASSKGSHSHHCQHVALLSVAPCSCTSQRPSCRTELCITPGAPLDDMVASVPPAYGADAIRYARASRSRTPGAPPIASAACAKQKIKLQACSSCF